MAENLEKQKSEEEDEELKKLRALAEETKKAQEIIEETLAKRKDRLKSEKESLSKQVKAIEEDQSKILEEESANDEVEIAKATEEKEVSPVETSAPEDDVVEAKNPKELRNDKENANPDGNGTQVLLGGTSDQFIQEAQPEAEKTNQNINSTENVLSEGLQSETNTPVEVKQDLQIENTEESNLIPNEVGKEIEVQTQAKTELPKTNPELEVIPAKEMQPINGDPTNPEQTEDSDFANNVLQQFPEEQKIVDSTVGPSIVGAEQKSPVGDDGELLEPDLSVVSNVNMSPVNQTDEKLKNENTSSNDLESIKPKMTDSQSLEAQVQNNIPKPSENPKQQVITQTSGASVEKPSAVHPTVQPLAANYRSIDDMLDADSKAAPNIENVQNINNVENNVTNSPDNSVNTQNTTEVVEKKEEEKEEKKEEIKPTEVIQNQTFQQTPAGLPPLPTNTTTVVEKPVKDTTSVAQKVEKVKNPPKQGNSSPGTSDIILVILLVVSLVLIGTIVYFSYILTPEEGSIWIEVRQNIDNFISALGL